MGGKILYQLITFFQGQLTPRLNFNFIKGTLTLNFNFIKGTLTN